MLLTRRGVSLVELVVAVSVTGLIALITGTVLTRTRARLEDRKARLGSEQALRAAAAAVRAFLQDGEPSGPDLQAVSPVGLTVRVVRGSSVLCSVAPALVVARRGDWWNALREPVAGRDSLALGNATGTGWVLDALGAVPGPATCPDGSAGIGLPVALDPVTIAGLAPGSPVRFFEPVELRSYPSSGSDWIGVRQLATGEAIQPLAGPLLRPGLRLEYFAMDGSSTVQPSAVALVRFQIRVLGTDGRPDSVTGTVRLSGGQR